MIINGNGGYGLLAAYRRACGSSRLACFKGRRPPGAVLYSSREPSEHRNGSAMMISSWLLLLLLLLLLVNGDRDLPVLNSGIIEWPVKLYVGLRFLHYLRFFSKSNKHDFLRFLSCCTCFLEHWYMLERYMLSPVRLSLCLSVRHVCLSETRVDRGSDANGWSLDHATFTTSSPVTLVSSRLTSLRNSTEDIGSAGAE